MMVAMPEIDAELGRHVPSGGGSFEEGLGNRVGKAAGHPPEEELPHKAPASSAPALAGDGTRF